MPTPYSILLQRFSRSHFVRETIRRSSMDFIPERGGGNDRRSRTSLRHRTCTNVHPVQKSMTCFEEAVRQTQPQIEWKQLHG